LEALIVGSAVDVEQNPNILHLHPDDSLQMTPEDCPAPDISLEGHDLGKDRAIQENWISAGAFVCGNHNLRFRAAILLDDLAEGLRPNKRLIRENNQSGVYLLELAIP
jgi:hypothetical protein